MGEILKREEVRKDGSPEAKASKKELTRKGKVLPEAEAARQKPPRCEKALKEMESPREALPSGRKPQVP